MKIVTNYKEAVCALCGTTGKLIIDGDNVKCEFCLSTYLKNKKGEEFNPIWIHNRRHSLRQWGNTVERRGLSHASR